MENNKNNKEPINENPTYQTEKLPVFSDELTKIFQWITFSTLNQVVALFGVGSNIINIICFVKQGFKDPVNVSLLGLAVADLCCLVTITWTNVCANPAFLSADLPFEPMEFQHMVSAMPHFTFNRISSWITSLITLERCLCIIVPLKVKSMVTSKRMCIIIICVFFILLMTSAPIYFVNKLDLKFYPSKNKTLIGITFMGNRESVETVSYVTNNVCIPFGAFITITSCTLVLVFQLNKKTKWRKTAAASTQADKVSIRNDKVAKMVVTISGVFIFCMSPSCVLFIAMSVIPSLSIVGTHRNALLLFSGFGILIESVNSAVNIFIYYEMSTKYRVTLQQLLCLMH